MTGVYIFDAAMEAKRLGLLRELVPNAALIAVLLNPSNANFEASVNDVEQGARAVGQQIHILKASAEQNIDATFAALVQRRVSALSVWRVIRSSAARARSLPICRYCCQPRSSW